MAFESALPLRRLAVRLIEGIDGTLLVLTLTLAFMRNIVLLGIMMGVGGAAWMTLTSTFTVAAQTVVPAWMRARALAMYLLVFNGGMAVGSALWGVIAARASIPLALMSAAFGLILGLTTLTRYRLVTAEV